MEDVDALCMPIEATAELAVTAQARRPSSSKCSTSAQNFALKNLCTFACVFLLFAALQRHIHLTSLVDQVQMLDINLFREGEKSTPRHKVSSQKLIDML